MSSRPGRLSILALAAALVTGSCSESSPRASARPEPLPTDFVSGEPCDPLDVDRLPANAGCATEVEGDADGDGSSDRLTVYARLGDDRHPRSWRLRLQTAAGASDQPLDAGSRFSYPRAVGAADVDGDGRSEWFVKTLDLAGHGTSWKQLNMFVLRGDRLAIVTHEGQPLALRVGGITRMGEGVGCRDGRLVLLRAEARNVRNTRWETSARSFELEGPETRFAERTQGRLNLSDYNDPDLNPFYQLNCGALSYSA
ncbi:MAG: hypothetical protein ACRDJL_12030 [Actinomycetota bacterium]